MVVYHVLRISIRPRGSPARRARGWSGRPPRAASARAADRARRTRASSSPSSRSHKGPEAGDLDPSADPAQIAFELDALTTAANQHYQLTRDPIAFDRAERAITARLDSLAT